MKTHFVGTWKIGPKDRGHNNIPTRLSVRFPHGSVQIEVAQNVGWASARSELVPPCIEIGKSRAFSTLRPRRGSRNVRDREVVAISFPKHLNSVRFLHFFGVRQLIAALVSLDRQCFERPLEHEVFQKCSGGLRTESGDESPHSKKGQKSNSGHMKNRRPTSRHYRLVGEQHADAGAIVD